MHWNIRQEPCTATLLGARCHEIWNQHVVLEADL